jgi:ribosome maturation factor RimP
VGVSPFFISGEFLRKFDLCRVGVSLWIQEEIEALPFDVVHVRELAERVAGCLGLEVVDIEFQGTAKARTLRVFVEKNAEGRRALEQQLAAAAAAGEKVPAQHNWEQLAGVTHEDCAEFSRQLGTVLDVEDVIPGGEYLLEVSSPGLDRKLTRPSDFERFTGGKVKLMTREPISGNRHFEGRLRGTLNGRVQIDLESDRKKGKRAKADGDKSDSRTLDIEMSNVERARLVPEF